MANHSAVSLYIGGGGVEEGGGHKVIELYLTISVLVNGIRRNVLVQLMSQGKLPWSSTAHAHKTRPSI